MEPLMRILFVSPVFPEDPSRSVHGVFQRMRMWLDAIRSLESELDILFFRPAGSSAAPETAALVTRRLEDAWRVRANVVLCEREPDEPSRPGRLRSYASSLLRPALAPSQHPYFRPYLGRRQREAFARCLARSPDIVFFHRLQATGPAGSLRLGDARTYLDLDDLEHRKFARDVAQPPRWRLKPLLYLQVPALWWGERAAIASSTLAFVCSEADRRYLRRTMRVDNVEVVPNAVPRIDGGTLTSEPNVLFIGTYGYAPNAAAADVLIREVWPHVTRRNPNARLLIAGPHPELIPSVRNPPGGVEFLGFVSDLDALYRRTRVVCCPIRSGGGTRVKILEAASYGVPVVSTPEGVEGLDLVAETEILVRERPAGLAEACGALLADDERARRIGLLARDRVRARYDRAAVVGRMGAILARDAA
jgi:glycosyltransferase involved in cell wall biosynthesis